jgi:hypothetical protein
MTPSLRIEGIIPPDTRFLRMKAVWDACMTAGVEVPKTVAAFFDGETPHSDGVKKDLRECISECVCRLSMSGERIDGYDIEISKLPPDIEYIRVYMTC